MVRCCQVRSAANESMCGSRRRAAVVARHFGDDLDLPRVEAVEVGGGDEVVAVLVVAFEVDRVTDVVQQGGELEPFALACAEIVDRGGEVEQADREARHLLRVSRASRAPGSRGQHLAAADLAGDGESSVAGAPSASSTRPSRSARSQR